MTKEKTLGPDPPEHGQEDTAAGFFAFNPQTLNITRATATFSRILGHTPENLIPSPLSRIWPDGAEREEFIRLISRQEAARNYPVDLVCHDGTILPVTITAASLSEMEVVCIVSPRHPGLQEEDLQILNSLMDTVLILDWDGTALFANAAAATLVGIPSSDVLIGQSPLQFAHPDYAESIISDLMNVRSGREGYPGYYMMRDLHGNDKLIEGVGTKIIFKGQEANLVALREITGRKGAEDELIRTNQHFRDLYRLVRMMCDNVPDLIWAKNMENQYLFTNKATCEKLLNAADTSEPLGKTGAYFAERER
ncbi:MAG: PAS domain S-box protein, partial [Methanomicrobiales archaeon]|nr:PAS domain S-box protein [Methanomicrobiales archaeon]